MARTVSHGARGVATQIAKQLGMSPNWISETVHRYNTEAADGVKNKSKNQASKTLTEEQIKELEKEIESGRTADERLWSSSQIKRWVTEKTGKQIHKTTAWRMLVRLNFNCQVPRPSHHGKADEKEQADFKKS